VVPGSPAEVAEGDDADETLAVDDREAVMTGAAELPVQLLDGHAGGDGVGVDVMTSPTRTVCMMSTSSGSP
jgi:hypothetical protein